MSQSANNIDYVKEALDSSKRNNSYPAIYVLWGCIIFFGFAISEVKLEWTNTFWLIAAPIGMLISGYLGMRADKAKGQVQAQTGKLYMQHFGVLLVAIVCAMLTQQYASILLLVALGYCLAGIHFEIAMLWIGLLTLVTYLGVAFNIINSHLIIGAALAAGCFVTAWITKNMQQS